MRKWREQGQQWRRILLAGIFAIARLNANDATTAPTDILERPNLLDDWSGWRSRLNDAGWQPFATWTGEVWGNTQGGIRRGMTDDMLFTGGGEADLQKLVGWPGGTLRTSFNWVQSTHPNHNTGAFNEPTSIDASDQVRVYNIYLRQKLFDDQLMLKLGQMGADDDFGQCPATALYLNPGLTAPPVIYNQVLANGNPSLPHYPLDAPGILVRLEPKGFSGYLQSGLYLSDAGPDVSHNHGFDWHASNSVAVMEEAGWNYLLAQKAGTLAVGAFYNDGQFTNWDNGAAQRGIYGVYGFINQVLWQNDGVQGADPQPVFSGFIQGGFAGPDSRANANLYFAGGLNWMGPLPGCPQDSAGIACLYTGFSPNYTRSAFNPNGPGVNTAAETGVEFTYQMAVTPWCSLQPDLQFVFNPANASTRATAVTVGVRVAVKF